MLRQLGEVVGVQMGDEDVVHDLQGNLHRCGCPLVGIGFTVLGHCLTPLLLPYLQWFVAQYRWSLGETWANAASVRGRLVLAVHGR